jgi:DNA-binding response OmpR family regulator
MLELRHPVRALIVEDEPLIAMHIRDMMVGLGFDEVVCARDLDGGRALTAAAAPDVAILDINLGEDLVFPLAEDLRALGVPIVFSSSQSLPPAWMGYAHVQKPFDLSALEAAIRASGMAALRAEHEGDAP